MKFSRLSLAILITALPTSFSYVAFAESDDSSKTEKRMLVDDTKNSETGFYAMLRPAVGGGRFIFHYGATMKYLSEYPVFEVRDIKISSISHYYVVKIFMDSESRDALMEDQALPIPSYLGVDYLEDGQIVWSRSVSDILEENWITVGIFKESREAEKLTERLRFSNQVQSSSRVAQAEQGDNDQSSAEPKLSSESTE